MTTTSSSTPFSTVLIIGAGAAGICTGIKLKTKLHLDDFVIYERHADLGGTWWQNTYPGCACDIPSIVYSYSFAQNPNWSTFYASAPEIHDYFNRVSNEYNITPHVRLNTECLSCVYDEERSLWVVTLQQRRKKKDWRDGLTKEQDMYKVFRGKVDDNEKEKEEEEQEEERVWKHECKVLVTCVGGLVNVKQIPHMQGQEQFAGKIFHANNWDHSVDLHNKNVIVVGNGASALQFIPEILPNVKQLTHITRSSHWIVPRTLPPKPLINFPQSWMSRNIPGALYAFRLFVHAIIELQFLGFRDGRVARWVRKAMVKEAVENIQNKAPEKYWDLLIPDFDIGCKRRIFDHKYLPALHNPKINLIRSTISHISSPNTVTTTSPDSTTYPADIIIHATGFQTETYITPLKIRGRKNLDLQQHWDNVGGANAYHGTTVAGFPNFFMIPGPNTATGHSSVILAIENMTDYFVKVVRPVVEGRVEEVEVKKEAEMGYREWIQEGLKGAVFSFGGCRAWYQTKTGWNPHTYPYSQISFTIRSLMPKWSDYIVTPAKSSRRSITGSMFNVNQFILPFILLVISYLAFTFREEQAVGAHHHLHHEKKVMMFAAAEA